MQGNWKLNSGHLKLYKLKYLIFNYYIDDAGPADIKLYELGSLPYYLIQHPGTWFDASDFCNHANSSLASIPSSNRDRVLDIISTHVTNLNLGFVDAWLGLRKQEFKYNTCKLLYLFFLLYSQAKIYFNYYCIIA